MPTKTPEGKKPRSAEIGTSSSLGSRQIDSSSPIASSESPEAASPGSAEQIAQLQQLTTELVNQIATLQARNARDSAFLEAVNGVKLASKAILMSPVSRAASVEQAPGYSISAAEKECGCCDCLSDKCCSFQIILTHIRVTHMQIEPVDSNINPLAHMEVRVFAAINGIGALYPNLWSHALLHKTLFDQGVWQGVNVPIGTVEVCKGQPKSIPIEFSAVEIDSLEAGALEPITALRDEYGSNTELMTLDCCCSTTPTKDIEVRFTGGGLGRGSIEGRFEARRRCC